MSISTLGKYRIIEELGRGGMGAVYKAYDPDLDRTVAIKVLAPHLAWDKGFIERFSREARAAARLDHPHIIHIFDVGHDETRYYFVMAHLPGPSLKQFLSEKGRLTPAEALPLLHQLADALDYAHGKGLVHRDVKPANVMFNEHGQAVLTDFGLVKAAQEATLTATDRPIGSPRYMAPEQVKGAGVDARTDEYALGLVAFEMLTGRAPFEADTPLALQHKHLNEPPPFAVALCPDLPRAVDRALNRALAKSPNDRYASCGEFVQVLEQAWVQPAAKLKPVLQPSAPLESAAGKTVTLRMLRKPPPLLLAGAGILALASLTLWIGTVVIGKGQATPTPVAAVQPTLTITTLPASPTTQPTNTPVPSTPTAQPTNTAVPVAPTMTPTATLGIGSTRISEKDGMVMVYVPAGEFLMGSANSDSLAFSDEKPQHTVYLDAFWIDKTEMTNAQYKQCVQAGACKASEYVDKSTYNGDTQPVVSVDWDAAQAYCQWAGRQLPTEAQWGKAARGTDGRIYPWGNQTATCEYAVMNDGKGYGCGKGDAAWPVGSKPKDASPYGALDMAGNVWEWVADWYSENNYAGSPLKNPQGPASGEYRVLRGGSFLNAALLVRGACRNWNVPWGWRTPRGFRCVCASGSSSGC